MLDSLRYGVPGGLFAFALFWLQSAYLTSVPVYARWVLVPSFILTLSLWSFRQRNQHHFPFSYAFFSGFNVGFVYTLIQALLILLIGGEQFIESPGDISPLKWTFFIIFQESVGLLAFTLMLLLVLGLLLRKRT